MPPRNAVRSRDKRERTAAVSPSSATNERSIMTYTTSQNGTKTVLTFTASDTFTVPSGVTSLEVLAVAGGGGGGYGAGGGGGAGGIVYHSAYAVMPTDSIAVTVGVGGSGGSSTGPTGLLQTCGRVRKMRPRSRKSQSKCPAQTLGASRAFGPRNARRSVVPRANITSNAANRAILPTRDTAGWSSQRHASSRHTFTRQREKPL